MKRCFATLALLLFALPARATVLINSGMSYGSLQTAVNNATNGDTLLLEAGVYDENIVISNKDLTLLGGYDDASFTARNGDSVVNGQRLDTTLWFMDSSSRVDRVHFTGGAGNAVNLWCGGGVLLHRSWVEFNDCRLYSNSAWFGGGLFVGQFSYVKLTGASLVCTNTAALSGGGIYVDGRCDIVSADVEVFENTANEGHGGGIWVETGYLRLFQGDVRANAALPGAGGVAALGGGVGASGSFVELRDTVVMGENEAVNGGALALLNSTGHLGQAWVDCQLRANIASAHGGGVYASNSVIHFDGFDFWANEAGQDGGGAWFHSCVIDSGTNTVSGWINRAGGNGGMFYLDNCDFRAFGMICAGYSEGQGNAAGGHGGGLFATNSEIELSGCFFKHNVATNAGGLGGALALERSTLRVTNSPVELDSEYEMPRFEINSASANTGNGGAIWVGVGSTAKVWLATFTSNRACRGAAIFAEQGSAVELTDCSLVENVAGEDGGGLYIFPAGGDLTDCLFHRNRAGHDGGGVYLVSGKLNFYSCSLVENAATNRGGGLYALGGDVAMYGAEAYYSVGNGWPMLFSGNVALNAGGAASLNHGTALISQAAFIGNSAPSYASGIEVVGGLLHLGNSLIADGTQPEGGMGSPGAALTLSSATGSVFGSTLANNAGGGVRMYGGVLGITNSILWNGQKQIDTNAGGVNVIGIYHTDVLGGWPGAGNIDAEPNFYPNYHLRHGSPCIGAGSAPTGPFVLDYWDIDGEHRTNPVYGVGGVCDMGCDEYADTDGDRLPNIVETFTGVHVDDMDMGTNPNDPDSDGDAVGDGDEWIADTDPTNGDDYLRIIGMHRDPTDGAIWVTWRGGYNSVQRLECGLSLDGAWDQGYVQYAPPHAATNTGSIIDFAATSQVYRVTASR